jgi:hypothetical protein
LRQLAVAVHRDPMDDGVAHLGSIIAAHLREWDTSPAFVELAIFESDDARVIAAAIDAFCARHLGARCGHALATDERGEASAFAHLAWTVLAM